MRSCLDSNPSEGRKIEWRKKKRQEKEKCKKACHI
jgi:hypothetical protein